MIVINKWIYNAWITLEHWRVYNERLNRISNTNYKKSEAEGEYTVVLEILL